MKRFVGNFALGTVDFHGGRGEMCGVLLERIVDLK